jgi:PAS domain S-box-containing protein
MPMLVSAPERGALLVTSAQPWTMSNDRRRAQRSVQLQRATTMLAAALTEDDVAGALLAVTGEILESSAGVVYLQDVEGQLRLAASRGVPHSIARWNVLPPEAPVPLASAVADRSPIFISTRAEILTRYPSLAASEMPADRMQALAAVPLVQGPRIVGGFVVSFDHERAFDTEERRWLDGIATQAALAADRARLYEGERRAREEAETLFRISESLSATGLELETVVQRVTDEATRVTGAEFGAFFYNVLDAAGESYLLYTLSGAPKEAFAKFGLPRNTPLFAATFAGEGIVRLDDVKQDPRYGQVAPHYGMPKGHLPVTSYLAVPVIARNGHVLGGLFFGHSQAGRFTAAHERITKALAASAALAIDNATLFRAARDAEGEQRRAAEQLRETVRFNDLFVGVLAHDLRSPLAAIVTGAELVRARLHEAGDDRNLKPIGRMLTSGQRMARMIEQLLDFTRLRFGGGMTLERRPTDLEALTRQSIEELDGATAQQSIQLETTGDVRGAFDPDRLGQVLSNLLANALHHGRAESGVRVRIAGDAADVVRIEVHNMGAIPRELLPAVFEPLTGGDRRRDKSRGLGLGLFITRAIARAHGGDVSVSSTEAGGTTFVATLPRTAEAVTHPTVAPEPGHTPLPEGEARFRLLVDAVKDYAIFMLDPTGRVATWNEGAKRIKGYEASEIIGQHFSRFYEEADVKAGKCEHELEVAAAEGRFEDEGWRLRKDGSRFWANVVITALHGPSGELVGFSKVTRDLTERRRLQDEQIRLARAEEAIRLRDEFLALASHELKTPLTVLQIQLDTLRAHFPPGDNKAATKLQRASRSGDRLALLVESLLDVSRIATGRFTLDPKPFDVGEAIGRLIDGLRPAAAAAGCVLTFRVEGALTAVWDLLRIEQVVTNLVGNAIKYATGAPIAVAIFPRDDDIVLQVRDHGPGVPESERQRIFGRFERAEAIGHHGGLGLGLYLTHEIVTAHGGTVSARNVADGGACFEVRLPRRFPAWETRR